ncbi:MAG TPA: CAP domain-containing protein [Methanospirillum sp.]|nr:CAP domain-containing protein [Methanospirillum sp.]
MKGLVFFILLFISLIFTQTVYAQETPSEENISPLQAVLTPDLSLSDLVLPPIVHGNEKIAGSVIVTNRGPVPATHIVMDVLLMQENPDGRISIWIGSKSTDGMAPGTRGKIPFSFDIPSGIQDGEYNLLITIQGYERELFPSDNFIIASHPVTIQKNIPWKGGNPNLQIVVDKVSKNSTSPGTPLTITYTILNTNNESAGAYKTLFLLLPDRTNEYAGYHLREKQSFSVSGKMYEHMISEDLVPDTIPVGTYFLAAIVDYTGMIQETNEADNLFIYPEPIQITYPENLFSDSYGDQITGYLYLKTNKYREHLGLVPLVFDNGLSTLALDHTKDMIRRKYFSHYTPEGIDPTGRAEINGYEVTRRLDDGTIRAGIAENIIRIAAGHTIGKAYTGFVDPTTPEEVANIMMIEWINSPEHNKNLINPTIEKIGIGTRFDGEYFYATQDFF